MTTGNFSCIACGAPRTSRLDDRAVTLGVTSDCKIWPRCGAFFVCEECGHVQKRQDDLWQADVASIYGSYEMYTLSNGNEQVIFDAGAPLPRTRRLLDQFCRKVNLPPRGDWLDIGCGNGSTLRTVNGLRPDWRLAGFDIHNRFEPALRTVPGFEAFYHGSTATIDQQFDVVSMVYVIEHIPQPLEAVRQLVRLLKPGGVLFLHTSNYWDNPFDLCVVDHCSHFNREALAGMTHRSGFEIVDSNDDWIAKETGVIARLGNGRAPHSPAVADIRRGANERLQWLGAIVDEVSTLGPIGVFGTAIAGTWLGGMIGASLQFFVDEDSQRVGKTHLGKPIYSPQTAPRHVPVCIAFPPLAAANIAARLSRSAPNLQLWAPPKYQRRAAA